MLRLMIHKNPSMIGYLVISPFRSLSAVVLAWALSMAIDLANSGDLTNVWKYVVFFTAYVLIDLLIDGADYYFRLRAVKKTMVALKRDLAHKLMRMPSVRFYQKNTADYISNMTGDTESLRNSYFLLLLDMYADFMVCLVALVIMMWISPLLGVFVLVLSAIQSLVPMFFSSRLNKAGEAFSDAQEKHMKVLKESLSAFLTAKIFHIEKNIETNYDEALEEFEETRRSRSRIREWSNSVSYAFNQASLLGVFLIGAVLHIRGMVSIAEVVAASQLITYISNPVQWLNGNLADLKAAGAPMKKLRSILEEAEDNGGTKELPSYGGDLIIRNLGFAYGERKILNDFSYTFEHGKKYLIVGSSGSGKSTLLELIAGLRFDYQGEILLSGIALRELSRQSLTGNICLISQEPFLFDDSLFHNVSLYEEMDEERVKETLQKVGLEPLLATMENGIHTRLKENASNMSGGEKQRVAIARAILRHTPILLLDESTSHLDPVTAADIEHLVLGLDDVTVLLVSHAATDTAKQMVDHVIELVP